MKSSPLTVPLRISAPVDEIAMWKRAAATAGIPLSEWLRRAALHGEPAAAGELGSVSFRVSADDAETLKQQAGDLGVPNLVRQRARAAVAEHRKG